MRPHRLNFWWLSLIVLSISNLPACGGPPATTSPYYELAGTTLQLTKLNG